MQKFFNRWPYLVVLLALLFFEGCESELDKYYKTPDWLKGNAWELLESKGNFTQFLEAVELAGYKDVISGRGIITVMAPTDDAFTSYLSSKGYSSVSDIPSEDLEKLVGFHLVYYSFDKDKLANYRPEGITDETDYTDAGLYYKFRTKSSDPVEEYTDNTVASGSSDPTTKTVYHKERFLPVLSNYLFESKGIDAKYNYQYFYPNTTWTTDSSGFCVSNANVEEYALITDNGYVYVINQVLEPLETVHKELEESGYTLFKQLYDKFQEFELDEDLTESYGNGTDLYLYYHTDLPKIASEWTYNGESTLEDYADLATLSRVAYNVFAPTNESLQEFFNSFWKEYYTSITDVKFIPIKYLLDNHVYEGDIIFPEEISNGKISTEFGNTVDFDVTNTATAKLCVNGVLYGLNDLMVPPMYSSVTGPLFQDPNMTIFLQMIDETSMMLPLASTEVGFNFFMPSDTVVLNTTIGGLTLLYENTNPNKYGEQTILIESDAGYTELSSSLKKEFVYNHICNKLMTTVGSEKVYKTMNSYQYILVDNNTYAYSSNIYNNYNSSPAIITSITSQTNGTSYKISNKDSKALTADESEFKSQIALNTPSGFEKFAELVSTAQLYTESPSFSFLKSTRFIALVPTNDAISAKLATLPTTASEMNVYLRRYFIDLTTSGIGDYPFPGAGIDGEVTTYYPTSSGYAKLTIIDNGTSLQIKDASGNIVNVVGVFPRIYDDGAAYIIDGLLEL